MDRQWNVFDISMFDRDKRPSFMNIHDNCKAAADNGDVQNGRT
jgi:hypothetical protein